MTSKGVSAGAQRVQRGGMDRLVTRRLGSLFGSGQLQPVGRRVMKDTYAGRFPSGMLALFAATQLVEF
jgi:hypothetical protein